MRRLGDRIFVELGHHGSNNGVIVGDDGGLILVDAPQLPVDAQRWAQEVGRLGTPRYLVHTDHHPDHVVGNRWLGGTVVAHRLTRERLRDAGPSLEDLRALFGVIDPSSVPSLDGYVPRLPQVTFDTRLDLWVGGVQAVALHAPGHTANTVMVHVPQEGVLFAGDNVCEAGLPGFGDARVDAVLDALDLAASLGCAHIVPGHGDVTGPEGIDRYRELVRELVARVAEARARGLGRAECAARIRYPDRIHRDVPGRPDYPAQLVDSFQVASIERIFDDLDRVPELRDR